MNPPNIDALIFSDCFSKSSARAFDPAGRADGHTLAHQAERLDYDTLAALCANRVGVIDTPCPLCGPWRRSAVNRSRPVLRLWREPGWCSYHCARCGAHGYARAGGTAPIDLARLRDLKAEAAKRDRNRAANQLGKARWLWRQRKPIIHTPAETYLRTARSYPGPIPATLGFLPARGNYPPAMIAAFGLADEPMPGMVAIPDTAVRGLHLTRLAPNGGAQAGTERDKIIIGSCLGSPLVLAPMSDLLALAITEGIEDALSVHVATGLGVWAAGSASRMPALGATVPAHASCVTVIGDDDLAGRRHARELAERLDAHGLYVELKFLRDQR